MKSIINYLKEVRFEIKKVSWPSKEKVITHTQVVIVVSMAFGAFLAVSDYLLAQGLKLIVNL